MTYNKSLVSIIVRTTPKQQLSVFIEAINSILSNSYRPIEIVIIVQSETETYFKRIKNYIDNLTEKFVFFNIIQNQTSIDQRARNLNIGLNQSNGRFIGFLDDDDILYSNHIETLVNSLISSEYLWAYTDVTLSINQVDNDNSISVISNELKFKKDRFTIDEFLKDSFIPIHSFIIDTFKIDKRKLCFDESFVVLEDYVFLLILVSFSIPLYIPVITCEYRMFTDSRNTNYYINQYMGVNYYDKMLLWIEAKRKVEVIKKRLFPFYKPSNLIIKNIKFYFARFPLLYKIKRSLFALKKSN
jgi:glycosyltransferase involved in cell wall biosynthesis